MTDEEIKDKVAACFERHAENALNDSMFLPADIEERVAALVREAENAAYERAAVGLEERRDIGHEFCAVRFAAAIRALKGEKE